MKRILIFITAVVISAIIIVISKPYIDEYKTKQKYEFNLQTIDGKINLSDFKGKTVAIYFGYMYCPDICPTSLSMLSEALRGLTKEELDNFVGIFISVDPQRDKLKNLKEYAQYFHPSFIGATSDEENILNIANNYEAYYKLEKKDETDMNYSVSHTSTIYIFNREGNLSSKLEHFLTPYEITDALKKTF